jgi:branched-chain amino acid transport system permease protein
MAYAMVATGLSLVFGVLEVVNLSHGEFYMVAAYVLCAIMSEGISYIPACILSIIITAAIGYFFAVSVVRPAARLEPVNAMLATFGISTLMINLVLLIFTATPRMVSSPFQKVIHIGPIFLTAQKIIVIIMGLLLNAGLYLILHRTTFGKMIWAVSEQKIAAEIVGINTKLIYNISFTLGAVMSAVSGVLVSSLFSLSPDMGSTILTKCFSIVVLGGLGSILGAICGGMLLGLAESMMALLLPTQWSPAIAFVVLVVVLLVKPEGIIGKAKGVRV